jgi:hypothetical protein
MIIILKKKKFPCELKQFNILYNKVHLIHACLYSGSGKPDPKDPSLGEPKQKSHSLGPPKLMFPLGGKLKHPRYHPNHPDWDELDPRWEFYMQDLFTSQRRHYSNEEIKRRELFKLVKSDLKNSLTNTNFELFDSLLKNLDISDRQKHFIASSLSNKLKVETNTDKMLQKIITEQSLIHPDSGKEEVFIRSVVLLEQENVSRNKSLVISEFPEMDINKDFDPNWPYWGNRVKARGKSRSLSYFLDYFKDFWDYFVMLLYDHRMHFLNYGFYYCCPTILLVFFLIQYFNIYL